MKRPLASASIDELERQARATSERQALQEVLAELGHRSSARARRLVRQVSQRLQDSSNGPVARSLSPALLGRSVSKASPAERGQTYTSKPASELVAMKRDLQASIAATEDQLNQAEGAQEKHSMRLNQLRLRLQSHLNSLIPGYATFNASSNPTSNLERARNAEFDRLRSQAFQRWPLRAEFDATTALCAQSAQAVHVLQSKLKPLRAELDGLSQFLERNRLTLSVELENELIRRIASRISEGADEFDLLDEIAKEQHPDPVDILARARHFSGHTSSSQTQKSPKGQRA